MTKIDWPPGTPPDEIFKFEALHACIEDNKVAVTTQVGSVQRWLSINIIALAMLGIALAGGVWKMTTWAASVDASLRAQTQIMSDQKSETTALNGLISDVRVLQATSQENNTALLGPNSASNQRARRAAQ